MDREKRGEGERAACFINIYTRCDLRVTKTMVKSPHTLATLRLFQVVSSTQTRTFWQVVVTQLLVTMKIAAQACRQALNLASQIVSGKIQGIIMIRVFMLLIQRGTERSLEYVSHVSV